MPAKSTAAADPLYGAVTPIVPPRDAIADDMDRAAAESRAVDEAKAGRFDWRAAAKKHAVLLVGVGAVAAIGIAAVLGRKPLASAARTAIRTTARPMIARAALRRPLETARFAMRRPRLAGKIVSALR